MLNREICKRCFAQATRGYAAECQDNLNRYGAMKGEKPSFYITARADRMAADEWELLESETKNGEKYVWCVWRRKERWDMKRKHISRRPPEQCPYFLEQLVSNDKGTAKMQTKRAGECQQDAK